MRSEVNMIFKFKQSNDMNHSHLSQFQFHHHIKHVLLLIHSVGGDTHERKHVYLTISIIVVQAQVDDGAA